MPELIDKENRIAQESNEMLLRIFVSAIGYDYIAQIEKVHVIPVRGNGKTIAMKEALEQAAEQAQQIKQHLTMARLTPSTEELLEGVRLHETRRTNERRCRQCK